MNSGNLSDPPGQSRAFVHPIYVDFLVAPFAAFPFEQVRWIALLVPFLMVALWMARKEVET